VPERWRRTMPLALACGLYGMLLGLGFTTFVLAFAVWALAGISFAAGSPLLGLLIGFAFGVGRAMPIIWMAPKLTLAVAHLDTLAVSDTWVVYKDQGEGAQNLIGVSLLDPAKRRYIAGSRSRGRIGRPSLDGSTRPRIRTGLRTRLQHGECLPEPRDRSRYHDAAGANSPHRIGCLRDRDTRESRSRLRHHHSALTLPASSSSGAF
jgi:hypothetical protein